MELSQLTAYAEEKYHIREEYKWENFQSFSVLCDPVTGKWSVLLMRQWDGERGEMIERCDIKCGREVLKLQPKPYLSPPFQMRGNKWVGVRMGGDTEEEIVLRLFDRALEDAARHGAVVVLDGNAAGETDLTQGPQYGETAIVPGQNGANALEKAEKRGLVTRGLQGRQRASALSHQVKEDIIIKGLQSQQSAEYKDSVLTDRERAAARVNEIPEKLRQLKQLYHYTHSSFQQKCQDFYRQAKFMEDFEDDYPWKGEVYHFYPVYQDLRTEQLRGYFTWRTAVRRGEYRKISAPLAYIYVYELLNGIGADSVGDALHKLGEFEKEYLKSGIGSQDMIPTVRRWILDYCVVNQIDPETAGDYVASKATMQDKALAVLGQAEDYDDAAVFAAFCEMTTVKLAQSPVIKNQEQEGIRLFAGLWRFMQRVATRGDSSFFNQCFGTEKEAHYFPLSNAIYRMPEQREGTEYVLSGSHRFIYRKGSWYERTYPRAFFDRERLNSFAHEADRLLRLYLKTGRSIKARGSGVWAAPYIRTFLELEEKTRKEAAKPKIEIEFSRLAKIRQDAEKTCDSLLTEEERELEQTLRPDPCEVHVASEEESDPVKARNRTDIDGQEPGKRQSDTGAEESSTGKTVDRIDAQESGKDQSNAGAEESSTGKTVDRINGQESGLLPPLQLEIMRLLMKGEDTCPFLAEHHLMPTIVADEINEALYDEIGDMAVDCDGRQLSIIEDYMEEIQEILGCF